MFFCPARMTQPSLAFSHARIVGLKMGTPRQMSAHHEKSSMQCLGRSNFRICSVDISAGAVQGVYTRYLSGLGMRASTHGAGR